MEEEIVSFFKYEPKSDVKVCPCCEAENPMDEENCFLCGVNLNRVFRTEETIRLEKTEDPVRPEEPAMPREKKHGWVVWVAAAAAVAVAAIAFVFIGL